MSDETDNGAELASAFVAVVAKLQSFGEETTGPQPRLIDVERIRALVLEAAAFYEQCAAVDHPWERVNIFSVAKLSRAARFRIRKTKLSEAELAVIVPAEFERYARALSGALEALARYVVTQHGKSEQEARRLHRRGAENCERIRLGMALK